MTARAQSAEATRTRILEAGAGLLRSKFRSEIRLPELAECAGVSVQTLINVFGTKDEILSVALREMIRSAGSQRRAAAPHDIAGAILGLYEHYESVGDLVVRNLMEAADAELLEIGRTRHREWGEIYFRPRLAGLPGGDQQRRMDALLSICDVYVWRLLRRDNGRTIADAQASVLLAVSAILDA